MKIDRGKLVKKLIHCRLIESTWKIGEVSNYKTYQANRMIKSTWKLHSTNLHRLLINRHIDQSAYFAKEAQTLQNNSSSTSWGLTVFFCDGMWMKRREVKTFNFIDLSLFFGGGGRLFQKKGYFGCKEDVSKVHFVEWVWKLLFDCYDATCSRMPNLFNLQIN